MLWFITAQDRWAYYGTRKGITESEWLVEADTDTEAINHIENQFLSDWGEVVMCFMHKSEPADLQPSATLLESNSRPGKSLTRELIAAGQEAPDWYRAFARKQPREINDTES